MSCWKWFNIILEEAGVEVTEENRERIDQAIREYVNDRSSYGKCSAVMKEASSQITEDKNMHQELIEKVRVAAQPIKITQ